MCKLHVVATPEKNARALAGFIARWAGQAIADRGRFTIALSGGSTPRRVYEILTGPPYASQARWDRWHVFWGDERCVPPEDPSSNYRLAKEALLDSVPVPPSQVHRMRGEEPPEEAAERYEAELVGVLGGGTPELDLVLLGIGDDGHTASLFPGSAALEEDHRLVISSEGPRDGTHRLTFTLPLINAARAVAFLASDGSKAEAVRKSIEPHAGETAAPAALVKPASGALHWFLTTDAAQQLSRVTA